MGAGTAVWGKVRPSRKTAAAVLVVFPWARQWRLMKRFLEVGMLKSRRTMRGLRKLEAIRCELWIRQWGREELLEEVESMTSWRKIQF